LPAIKSIDKKPTTREPSSTLPQADEDVYLGWTLFKAADRPDLGLKEEKPLMINVKHTAQTYVVGIPEEYADAKSKSKKMMTPQIVLYIYILQSYRKQNLSR
jgi:hypothetical protein